jgi:hypothetical protein
MAPERTPLLAVFRLSADDGRYFAVISAGTAASSFAKRISTPSLRARATAVAFGRLFSEALLARERMFSATHDKTEVRPLRYGGCDLAFRPFA